MPLSTPAFENVPPPELEKLRAAWDAVLRVHLDAANAWMATVASELFERVDVALLAKAAVKATLQRLDLDVSEFARFIEEGRPPECWLDHELVPRFSYEEEEVEIAESLRGELFEKFERAFERATGAEQLLLALHGTWPEGDRLMRFVDGCDGLGLCALWKPALWRDEKLAGAVGNRLIALDASSAIGYYLLKDAERGLEHASRPAVFAMQLGWAAFDRHRSAPEGCEANSAVAEALAR